MKVKIRSPFKPEKICQLIGFEDGLCKLQAVNEFSLPGLNLKSGDRFLMSPNEILFPGDELAGDVMSVAREEIAAIKQQRDSMASALKKAYAVLCPLEFPGRASAESQAMLCEIRDLIAKTEVQS